MAEWIDRAVGEMSKMRDSFRGRFGWGTTTGTLGGGYKLDSSRVDYELAKALYYNTQDEYKLGAGFAKIIINNAVSFMGVPSFKSGDKEAHAVLEKFFLSNQSNMQKTTRNGLRDGDCFVWITREDVKDMTLYPEEKTRLIYNVLPPGQVKEIKRDPLTGDVEEYVLVSIHEWEDDRKNKKKGTITQRIRRREKIIEVEGDRPPDVEVGAHPTPWDFIPIIHFKNEGDEGVFGQSDLEAVEPYLKAYHDVLLHAMKGSKMHSTPRLKLSLKDVRSFLLNNFGVTDPKQFAKDGGEINLDGHELIMLTDGETAEFIEARSTTGDGKALLKLLFYCIVDASETPEFVFGVHTPSSLSSVKEQMPILIRSIERKREHFVDSWQRLARIVLAMTAHSENKHFETFATDVKWANIDARTGEEISAELLNIVNALVAAVSNNLASDEAAVNYLARHINTMNEWEVDEGESEQDRITKSRLNRLRMPDTEDLEEQLKIINRQLGKGDG
ncbi:phage portal protein [Sporosarcina sp. FSL K6-1508]|uniref:phage portal protein n=1 Tax=Sporosarcina sp. FSL K6-1508 TaxID=2921553 RepID=UPI0030F5CF84